MDADLSPRLQYLCEQALTGVVRWPAREPFRTRIYCLSIGRIGRCPRCSTGDLPTLSNLWHYTDSGR
ncbi:hypothetical protein J3R03_000200 [Actinoplanes couchii]|uniref:Transposase n=1 Tax=Actinoplanes couchii TaxID=403638 RepID=A0ABQ3WZI1_9ACTN|nr:hypothetical protein [Actinoplanes couchii]GID51617.1 hypothetical protein Aco03nite_000210 [Actinoplanes couchii]